MEGEVLYPARLGGKHLLGLASYGLQAGGSGNNFSPLSTFSW